MGITNLLPALNNSTESINIEEMAGSVVAIDASCWLHAGIYSCAIDLFLGKHTDSYVKYFMNKVEVLLRNGITPLVVFDGQNPLPAKARVAAERREKRTEAKQQAFICIKQKDMERARRYCCSAAEVTPEMVDNIIKALKDRGVDFVMAPYEADPQLALMSLSGTADYIITEDSDLLVFGAKQVIYKWNGYCGQIIRHHHLYRSFPDIPNFTFQKFQYICILAGCDYLQSLKNIGIQRAKTFVKALGDRDIFMQVKNIGNFIGRQTCVPPEYPEQLKMALNTFTYQIVYYPGKGYSPLHEYPPELSAADFQYAGLPLSGTPVADLSRTWISEQMLNRTDQSDFTFDGASSSDAESAKSTPYTLRSQQKTPVSTVFSVGEGLKWTPPCFPVMTVEFLTGTLSSEHDLTHKSCLFKASDHRILLYPPPFEIMIHRSCTITAENSSYIVVWEWDFCELHMNYAEDLLSQFSQTTISSYCDTVDGQYDTASDNESDNESDVLDLDSDNEAENEEHELPFKVMGVTYVERRQQILLWAYHEIFEGNEPPIVDLIPEVTNSNDENAIAVCIRTERGPETVGYIVKEMTQYIHPILNTGRLTCARIGRISFRIDFEHPGWYMKLLVTKKGTWDRAVIRHSYRVK